MSSIMPVINEEKDLGEPDFLGFLNQNHVLITISGEKGTRILAGGAVKDVMNALYREYNKRQILGGGGR